VASPSPTRMMDEDQRRLLRQRLDEV